MVGFSGVNSTSFMGYVNGARNGVKGIAPYRSSTGFASHFARAGSFALEQFHGIKLIS